MVKRSLSSSMAAPPLQRSRLLRDTLPEGVSPALVALLEQSDGEDEIENAKRGDGNVNSIDGAAGAPLSRKTFSSSSSLPPLSASERARAFAAAPRELEALRDHPVIASALFSTSSEDSGGNGAGETTTTTASEDAAATAEAAAVEAFVREAPALSQLATAASDADADLRALESSLSGFQGSLGTISSDIRGLQAASAALARRLSARRAAAAALAGALDALALPPRLALAVSEGDPSSPEFAAALADLGRRMRKLSGRGGDGAAAKGRRQSPGRAAPSFAPLRASRAAEEVLPQLDALRRAATQRSKGWLLPAIASLRAPRTNVHVLQRSVLAPRGAPLVRFLREFGGDDYFFEASPALSSSSSSSSSGSPPAPSGAYLEVRRAYVETLSAALERHLRRYVAAVGRLADFGGAPPLVGTGARPQIAPSARAEPGGATAAAGGGAGSAVAGALAAFVDAVASSSSSASSSSPSSASRSLDVAERGAILLHLDKPALVPGAATSAAAAAGAGAGGGGAAPRGGAGEGPSSASSPVSSAGGAAAAAAAAAAARHRPQQHQPHSRRRQQPARPPPEEALRSVCRLLADTATAEYVFCADFFGGDGAFRDGFGAAPLAAAESFLVGRLVAEADDPVALLLMARVVRHVALTMSRRRVPALDAHHDRLAMAIWPRLQLVLDAHVASLGAVEGRGGGGEGGGAPGAPSPSGVVGFFSAAAAAASSRAASSPSPSPEPALPGGAFHPLASRAGALEGALLALSSSAETGQLAMSLRRLRRSALAALRRLGGRQLAGAGGAEGRAEAAAFVAGNAHAVLGLLEGAAADAAARSHAGGGGSGGGGEEAAAATAAPIPSFTSPVFAALGAAGADAAAFWHASFEEAALEVAAEPVGRRFPGLLEAARALGEAARSREGGGDAPSSPPTLEQATAAARDALSAAFSPAPPSSGSSPAASAPASWASSLDAVRADVARYLRKNPGAARATAALAAAAVGGAYAACYEAVCSSPQSSSSPRLQQQQAQWPAPAVVARECARQ